MFGVCVFKPDRRLHKKYDYTEEEKINYQSKQ